MIFHVHGSPGGTEERAAKTLAVGHAAGRQAW
jgi:hypothetical protein